MSLPFPLSIGVCSNEVLVPERVSAVLGKNITLGCRVEVGTNLSLTQSSWERRLPSGTITLAVFNPQFGISISPDYARRLSFMNPSVHDATIVLEGVGFQDIGSYTCKVATFPLGNTQASITVNILGTWNSLDCVGPGQKWCTIEEIGGNFGCSHNGPWSKGVL